MSDLISRSELIKELNKYCGNQRYLVSENIREIINNQPTAYDLDKVVEELESEKSIHTENYNISLYKDCPEIKQRYKQACVVIDNTIEIVKQGGVGKDVNK